MIDQKIKSTRKSIKNEIHSEVGELKKSVETTSTGLKTLFANVDLAKEDAKQV